MGSVIKAKYDGVCKICGTEWKVDGQLYYQKTPKAICGNKECFTEQGGTVSNYQQSSFSNNSRDIIVTKIPDIDVGDSVKQVADVWMQYLVTAHHMAKAIYPEQDINTHVFGQIRSKLVDQLLFITKMQKE